MTRYERLIDLANRCRDTAKRCGEGFVAVWLAKAVQLRTMAESLKITEAGQK